MKSSPYRPLILQRRKLPLSHGDASSGALAGEEGSGGQGNGPLRHQQARAGERSTKRKTPGTLQLPAGIKTTDPPPAALPAGRNVLTIMEALAVAQGKEWGSSKPNKSIPLSSGSSSPAVEARELDQPFRSEDQHSSPSNKALEEDDAGPSSGATKGPAVWASESPSLEGQEQEGNSSREAPSCELDSSLTNIQWLGKMSSDGLSACSLTKGTEKENQTPKPEAAVQMERDAAPSSSSASWLEAFTERPPYSYMAMIQFAINSTERKRMTLKDIYAWIEDHFPYFKHVAKPGWKNSIRHNLSLHDMFVRETLANSKTSFWTIHPEANRYLTLDQVFKQQKRRTADLQKNPGSTGGNPAEPHPACRKMKPLLPRVSSYLVPVQFPLSQSLLLPPSTKIPLLVTQSTSEPAQSSKRVRIAPKVLPTSVKPPLFSPAVSIKEEASCGEDSSPPSASHQPAKEDARQSNRELLPAGLAIKKERGFSRSGAGAAPSRAALPGEELPGPGEGELGLLLPVPKRQRGRLGALEQPSQETPELQGHKWHRRKQLLAPPHPEEPVLLLPSSRAALDPFTLGQPHSSPLEQGGRPLGSATRMNCSRECGPCRTPAQETFGKQPASSPPCERPTGAPALTLAGPSLKEDSAPDLSPRRSPPAPLLSLQQNPGLSTSLGLSSCDSPQPPLLHPEASTMLSGPLASSPSSSSQSPPEFQASLLLLSPGNCPPPAEGLFLDPMNESLSKVLLDVSFPGFDEDSLGAPDLSWSHLLPDLK
ncbi:forkhead box protein M1 [Heteronotia binoei]|uniref:forkhead box protein M1 n=1 Tax=Heteronotia binoei TaxID=13085 RepID=UPI0029300AE5|nr:forkhead box protein M1 [Heteronotia binoei]